MGVGLAGVNADPGLEKPVPVFPGNATQAPTEVEV